MVGPSILYTHIAYTNYNIYLCTIFIFRLVELLYVQCRVHTLEKCFRRVWKRECVSLMFDISITENKHDSNNVIKNSRI